MVEVKNKLTIKIDSSVLAITYDQNTNCLLVPINKNYEEELVSFIRKYDFSSLKILSTSLITNSILMAIRDNKYINFIYLGSDIEPYTLTREVFDILNASDNLYSIDCNDVLGEYSSEEIEYIAFFDKVMVGSYKLSDIKCNKSFVFDAKLSEKEIWYLKRFISDNSSISFHYDDYKNIIYIIKELKGKNITFNIGVINKITSYLSLFRELTAFNEKIFILDGINLDQYLMVDDMLELMVKDIKEANLSLYEKYLAVYEIVTHFKLYYENNINKREARLLHYILFNYYIVCYGFSELLVALLDKVGIKAYNISVDYYKEKEEVSIKEQAQLSLDDILIKEGTRAYHARTMVRLVDDKYNINGLFIADSTWDNNIEKHYFNYSLLTYDEMLKENKEFYNTGINVLEIRSLNSFVEEVRVNKEYLKFFIDVIKSLDEEFYMYLVNKYNLCLNDYNLLEDIYNYIIRYAHNNINKDTKYKALKVLFAYIFQNINDNDLDNFIEGIKEDNDLRDKDIFNIERGRL